MDIDFDEVWTALRDSGLPKLWVPARDAFCEVAEIPILGSGKLDLRKVRELALQKTTEPTAGGGDAK
jgi:acyl-[acyl-carrier-protein]-phospholipid O-acyltransferase/long-chain-fatty-acid--[acyl-carrier-protein] ligase